MLQPSCVVGAMFVSGLLIHSPRQALCGLLGCICGTLTGWIPPMKKEDLHQGLYGFNAVLVGLALGYFYQLSSVVFIAIMLGACGSTLVTRAFLSFSLPPLTFPFILITWIAMGVLNAIGADNAVFASETSRVIFPLDALSLGFGQVMFQENVPTGIIFFFAIAWRSRWEAAHALLGTVLGVAVASACGLSTALTSLGIYGYNAVLCGIAFSGPKVKDWAWSLAAILLSIALIVGMQHTFIPPLTFPFVLSTWLLFYLRERLSPASSDAH